MVCLKCYHLYPLMGSKMIQSNQWPFARSRALIVNMPLGSSVVKSSPFLWILGWFPFSMWKDFGPEFLGWVILESGVLFCCFQAEQFVEHFHIINLVVETNSKQEKSGLIRYQIDDEYVPYIYIYIYIHVIWYNLGYTIMFVMHIISFCDVRICCWSPEEKSPRMSPWKSPQKLPKDKVRVVVGWLSHVGSLLIEQRGTLFIIIVELLYCSLV